MDLQLDTHPPDPIGFGNVSGFYGPGTWAAWCLTLAASWFRLRGHDRFDPNTWLFLAGLNWASFDLLQQLWTLLSLYHSGDDRWTKHAARVGAAFTMVCWGQAHGFLQVLVCAVPVFARGDWSRVKRGVALMTGTLFPVATMIAFVSMTGGIVGDTEITREIPALYYKGMPSRPRHKRSAPRAFQLPTAGHDTALRVPGIFGIFILMCYCIFGYSILRSNPVQERLDRLSKGSWTRSQSPLRRAPGSLSRMTASATTFFSKLPKRCTEVVVLVLGCFLGIIVGVPIFLLLTILLHNFQVCLQYIIAAYFIRGSLASESCFFMPCAPSSVIDIDQGFALFVGIFSTVVVEIIVPLVQRIHEHRQGGRLSLQDVERG